MNVTLRQLQIFSRVAACGSFTRAAEQLFMTQPAVSQQMRQLSEQVGEPLYDLVGRRVRITAAGQQLLATWQGMQQEWQRFEEEMDERRGLRRGSLRLAVVSTAKYFVPRALGPFCQRYPGIDVRLEVANRDRVVERIQRNLDDLYVMTTPPSQLDLVAEPILDNPLVVIAPPGHPCCQQRQVSLATLANERFIMREAGSGTRISIEQYLAEQQLSLNVRMELGSNEAIKQAVAGGLGLSILSRHALHRLPVEEDEVAILDVAGFPLASQWYLVHLNSKRLSLAATTFLEQLKGWLPSYRHHKGLTDDD
ncbi:MAG: LysR family transcriptional regulator [Gammaproteobacteria bacterium]|nr:LysR family transcriptional regulator [Gammaproteobacteria bacterium]